MSNDEKAQVTIFVILGLVLLLIVTLFIVIRKDIGTEPDPDDPRTTHDFSNAAAIYQAAADSCLELEGQRATTAVMANGGYLDPAAEGFHAVEEHPTKGNALLFGTRLVPYWLEHKGPVDCRGGCSFIEHVPPLTPESARPGKTIEERIEERMHPALKPCLDSIILPEDYETSMADDYDVEVTIAEERILYHLTRKVNITYLPGKETMTIDEVRGESAAYVKLLYENAIDLVEQLELSNETYSFGDAIALTIRSFGLGEDPELPPMDGKATFFERQPQRWLYPDVKETLQMRLADHLPLIQLRNTAGERLFLDQNRYSERMYNTNEFSPDVFWTYPNYAQELYIDFIYLPDWDIEFDVNPRNGYLIEPESGTFPLLEALPLGLTNYEFTYDLRVPLLVIIQDKVSFDGQGLTLLFAIETGLVANEPIVYGNASLINQEQADLFSSDGQRLFSLTRITTTDALTSQPLEGVEVTYVCGEDTSSAGMSDEQGVIDASLPFCLGGYLTATKDGYLSGITRHDMVDEDYVEREVELTPLKDYAIELRSYKLTKMPFVFPDEGELGPSAQTLADTFSARGKDILEQGFYWILGTSEGRLGADDQATLILTRETRPGEQDYVETVFLNLTNEAEQAVTLAAGTYDVQLYVNTLYGEGHAQDEFVVPEDEVCWGEGLFDGPEGCETIPEVVFNESLLRGGVELLANDGLGLEVTKDAYGNDTLTIYYLEIALSDVQKHEDLAVLGELDLHSQVYNETLTPAFSKEE